jgi:DNA-binding XRE family transcriptional regulator
MNIVIKKIRSDLEMSLDEFSKAINVCRSVIHFAEIGYRRCSIELALRLIKFVRDNRLPYRMEHFYYQDLNISIASIEKEIGFKLTINNEDRRKK